MGIRIDGKISSDGFDKIASFIEDKLEEYEKVRLYAEIVSYGGMSPSAVLKDIKFGIQHWKQIEKEALVTDQKWLQKIAEAGDKLFPSIDVKAFSFDDAKWAKKWVVEE